MDYWEVPFFGSFRRSGYMTSHGNRCSRLWCVEGSSEVVISECMDRMLAGDAFVLGFRGLGISGLEFRF